jgi:hypothetical protein
MSTASDEKNEIAVALPDTLRVKPFKYVTFVFSNEAGTECSEHG